MPTTSRSRIKLATATTAALASLTAMAYALPQATEAAAHTEPSAEPLAGLRVLLSNDDSMQAAKASHADGLGLYEMRKALCAAGADVVVMAPWQVQSGKGTAVTNGGALTLARRTRLPAGYENDCSGAPSGSPVYGVCLSDDACGAGTPSATPADTVKFALRSGLAAKVGWADGPDVVVTGINSGPNVSAQVNDSGTVGAAVAAIDEGVPAIAFSSSSGDSTNTYFPVANYRDNAEFGARLLAGMRERSLFTGKFAVKVDYPDVSGGRRAKAPLWTGIGHGKVVWHDYAARRGSGDTFDIVPGVCADRPGDSCTETVRRADSTALLSGHVAVAPVTADRTYGAIVDGGKNLRKLKHYVEQDAPRP
ncbi:MULTISPECIES: 5'/3'-nucleotidase SurE [unclassified Streptomyces]|uniref:5'/3'-nucleotidase SurE n=1 Tax=unclassified Streptomyces TaxID=2593676 RepID=UPI002DDAB94B|nr:5'/3'-nucleotidase SurE [Streptomyces sp. NBC_01445]WSE03348.1 5'/3'-nucleotidase SurE [Streptomyces sp. NBC_01445]